MVSVGGGVTITRFFQCIARFLQPLTDRPFGGLCAMLNGLARLYRSFLNGLTSFFYWTLILRSQGERYSE
jgi:hypothetical protein